MKVELLEKKSFTPEVIADAMTYEDYYTLIKKLLEEGKTTGKDQSNNHFKYARLNFQRMKRVYRTTKIQEELESTISKITSKQIWVVMTEGWCGDAAQSLPAMARISELSDKIELRILLRDENLEIMDRHLTNGGRSIPKLIALNSESLDEIFTWGPRPKVFQDMVMEHKQNPVETYEAFNNRLHRQYTEDKTISLQKELDELITGANT